MRRMYAQGMTLDAIGDHFGVTYERVRQILAEHYPGFTAHIIAARKHRRLRDEAHRSRTRHLAVQRRLRMGGGIIWTREAITERIQSWVEFYGRPPSAMEWNPSDAIARGRRDWADRYYTDGCWPNSWTVQEGFGSWNAAIAAAGYTPRKPGGKDPEVRPGHPLPPAVPLAGVE